MLESSQVLPYTPLKLWIEIISILSGINVKKIFFSNKTPVFGFDKSENSENTIVGNFITKY